MISRQIQRTKPFDFYVAKTIDPSQPLSKNIAMDKIQY